MSPGSGPHGPGTLSGGSITSSNEQRYWELDQLGNWFKLRDGLTGTSTVLEEREHNAANELTDFVTPTSYATPAEDDAGNMTTIPQPADPTAAFTLNYDAWNRLVEVKDSGNVVQQNAYDGLGRRIQRTAGGQTRDCYYNEDWQLLEERWGTGGADWHQYVWHPYYIDALAARWTPDGSSTDQHYFCQDANYNVTAVLSDIGQVVERYAYSPYGEVSFLTSAFSLLTSSLISNTHLYTGRERDSETGLQLNRRRIYIPRLGRWATRDPIGYVGGCSSLYEYVGNAPIQLLDPDGLQYYGFNPNPPPEGMCPCSKENQRSQTSCCNAAKAEGIDNGRIGGVICCDGRKVTCVWQTGGGDRGTGNDTANKIIDDCVHEHEETHKDQLWGCSKWCGSLSSPPFLPWENPDENECEAYKTELLCLRRNRDKCGSDPYCKDAITREWRAVSSQILEFCKGRH